MAEQRASSQFIGGDELRASDRDRELVARQLEEHYASGRLTLDEVQQRIDSAYSSRTYGDLRVILRDLPATHPVETSHPVSSAASQVREQFAKLPPGVREHLIRYAVIVTLLIVVWAATGAGFFWPIWPMIGLGVVYIRAANGHQGCMMRHQRGHPERS